MTKVLHKTTYLIIIVIMVFSFFTVVYAQNEYTVLTQLPGIGDSTGASAGKTTLETYLPAAFNLMIGISAILAFIVITWGGITYATSDALSGKEQGREWITNAVTGLLMVIGAWIILATINPQILNFNLLLPKPNIPAVTGVVAGVPLSDAELLLDKRVRDDLWNISKNMISAKLPCTQGQVTNCVNLNGLPNNAINGLLQLNILCGTVFCPIVITGGTEGGHVTHGVGQPIVDLRTGNRRLDNWIVTNGGTPTKTSLGPKYTINKNGLNATFLNEGNHWHVVFN